MSLISTLNIPEVEDFSFFFNYMCDIPYVTWMLSRRLLNQSPSSQIHVGMNLLSCLSVVVNYVVSWTSELMNLDLEAYKFLILSFLTFIIEHKICLLIFCCRFIQNFKILALSQVNWNIKLFRGKGTWL